MKIAIVAPYFYPRIGGLENYALNTAQNLRREGHEMFVVTSNHQAKTNTTETVEGLRVFRLAPWTIVSNTPVNPFWYFRLKQIFNREQPDAIIAHTPVPFLADMAARAAGRRPLILTYHNDLAKNGRLLRAVVALYQRLLGRGTLRRADRIITTSSYYAAQSPYLKPFSAKLAIAAPGVDTTRFNPHIGASSIKQRFGDQQLVLFVGSLAKTHAHKGLGLLMTAVSNLRSTHPRLHLVVVGQGDGAADYHQQAHKLGLTGHITFTGFVPDADLPAYYAAADVFVLPSTNPAEGFGMVLLEAAACGTPVVGTNVGGVPAALAIIGSPNLAEPTAASIRDHLKTVLAAEPRRSTGPAPVLPAVPSWAESARLTIDAIHAASRPRVALIHNVVAPYRLAMFERLAASTNLEVLFTQPTIKDRQWGELAGYTFTSRLLPSRSIGPVVFNRGGLRTLRQSRFDVLITNTDPDTAPLSLAGLLLAKLRRRPLIVWSEVTDEIVLSVPSLAYATHPLLRTLSRALQGSVLAYRKLFFRSTTTFLAFSDAAAQFLIRHGAEPKRIRRTFEIVPPEQLPEPTNHPVRSGKAFLFVGYLAKHKHTDLLIKAFTALADPQARLTIVGVGDEEVKLRALAAPDQRIRFVGYAANAQKAELYHSHDVLVLPSSRDCWGLVVNEAIHYGLAVIVSDAVVAKEIVPPSAGFIVPTGDAPALTEAMAELLAKPAQLHRMQAHNAKTAQVSDIALAVGPFEAAIKEATA